MIKRIKFFFKITRATTIVILISFLFFFSINFCKVQITPLTNLSFSMVIDEGFTNIFSHQAREKLTRTLLKGEKITGEFIAKENNLGIVLIKFFNFNRTNTDIVVFRIKESGADSLYYEQEYNVDQFQPNQYFTFGFPQISNSKNKKYYFEIESKQGKLTNGIALSKKEPQFATASQFTTENLSNLKDLLRFIHKRVLFVLKRIEYSFILKLYFYSLAIELMYRYHKRLKKISIPIFMKKPHDLIMQPVFIVGGKFLQNLSLLIQRWQAQIVLPFIKSVRNIHHKFFPALDIALILIIAFIVRISYYLNAENYNQLMFAHIGGKGDYAQLILHTFDYLVVNNLKSYFWSLMLDYIVNIRLFAIFFRIFGFINGLDYVEYFLIILSSLVTLGPFILLSRLKKFSLGGFFASLLLAVNPLAIWLSSARPLDTLTSFFFSIFIILFVITLEKRRFVYVFLLSVAVVFDVLNREMMLLNDLPALIFFAVFYIYQSWKKNLEKRNILYAVMPLITVIIFYLSWSNYYYNIFHLQWLFAPQILFTRWNPIHDYEGILGISIFDKTIHYLLQLFISFDRLPVFTAIPKEILLGLVIISIFWLIFEGNLRKKHYMLILIPFIFLTGIYFFHEFLVSSSQFSITVDISKTSWRYFLSLKNENFRLEVIFLGLIITQLLLLRAKFIKFILPVTSYFFIAGYGIYHHMTERHFIQFLLPLLFLIGLTIDKLAKNAEKVKFFRKILYLYLAGIAIYVASVTGIESVKLINSIKQIQYEKEYLRYVEKVLPKDATILVHQAGGQNILSVYKYAKRSMVFNVYQADPKFILFANNKNNQKIIYRNMFRDDFDFEKILQNDILFISYNFYILDYDIENWRFILKDANSGHPFFTNFVDKFTLRQAFSEFGHRAIYKLVLKESN